ncbi:DUF4168 domain-containing protein [Castellaniella ginsengisoli]|uniref:DUF4168 domain-containing protein n=1 Tax=Castellaniella ginsengisoli TaxID=546114 RepID=A0AB39GK54_9BURK
MNQAMKGFPPPGRPKAESPPLGGAASGQGLRGEGGLFPPPGRPKAESSPLGGAASSQGLRSVGAFLAASVIALGLAAPLTVVRTANAQAAYEVVDQPTDEQLQRYAAAVRKVGMVAAEYQPKLEAAQDEPARQAVRVEADQKMVDQVEAGGMSVAEYNGISRAVRENPELRRKVERLVGQ